MVNYSTDWYTTENCDSQSEGMVAKIERIRQKITSSLLHESVRQNGFSTHTSEADSEDDDDYINQQQSSDGMKNSDSTTRRVRSRSLIDDEQLAVLKRYYAVNPRPKKEEISMIASLLNFPTRVVQVCNCIYK